MYGSTALLTDKYEITMLQAALESGVAHRRSTFELFARKLPPGRRYGVVGGMTRAVEAVRAFRFTEEQIAHLASDPIFKPETLEYLRSYRFRGDLIGYAEGDVYFPYSPILTVTGTFADCVLLETVLLSILNHDSAVAAAASRMVVAADGRFPLIEMGSRRTHESSAVDAARVAYVAGFTASSNLEAGMRYGVPTTGTSAHAFTLAHGSEIDAFRAQVNALGTSTTLLVDTYDIEQGIRNAVAAGGTELGGIRIDSGDLHEEPRRARALLDSLGATKTKIVVSSDIDEYSIDELVKQNTPVDGVGAGTRVVTGSGHPTASMVFKLVEREEEGRMVPVAKKSSGKKSVGGLKHAYRTFDKDGIITGEYYTLNNVDAEGLQQVYLRDGEVEHLPNLQDSREHHRDTLKRLPTEAKLIAPGEATFIVENREV